MIESLVAVLRCPETRKDLVLAHVGAWFELQGRRHVVDGVLEAVGDPTKRYPILDEIPHLVPRMWIKDEEQAYLDSHLDDRRPDWDEARKVEPEIVTDADLEADIRSRMERQYRLTEASSALTRQRCEGEIRYMVSEARGTNKLKYVKALAPHIQQADSILETGGNFPGLTRSLNEKYRPSLAVVANIQILFPKAFKTPARDIAAVRADVQALPFKSHSFELVASGFMLEHVPDWKAGLRCMMDAGEKVFLAFGPNKWFPFEVGHINAPLAGTLPKPIAAYVAWLWLAAVGRRRPMHRIRAILGEVFHVGSRAFRREAERLGGVTRNLFPEIIEIIVSDQNAPPTGPRKVLQAFPRLAGFSARCLAAVGMEPQIYYLIDSSLDPTRASVEG